jgi:hypothetical protein
MHSYMRGEAEGLRNFLKDQKAASLWLLVGVVIQLGAVVLAFFAQR